MIEQESTVIIRLPPELAAGAGALAERDGTNLGTWVRRLVDHEIGLREGKCPACGQEVKA